MPAPTKEAIEKLAKKRYEDSRHANPDRPEWASAADGEKISWRESAEEWLRRPANAGKTGLEDDFPAPAAAEPETEPAA